MTTCQLLKWDTEFFGIRIGQYVPDRLRLEDADALAEWCRAEPIRCLYFLAVVDCAETAAVATERGFFGSDVRVMLDRKVDESLGFVSGVRPFVASDLPALKAIARVSHTDSRFYFDPGFPDERCDLLYQIWIEKSCRGEAESVLVAVDGSETVGYVTCHLVEHKAGSIGLFAVAAHARGRGVGSRLVSAALRHLSEAGCRRVTVVTQGRNLAAQRMYQAAGFRTADVHLWYHLWSESMAA
jgi:dTDP-4-amino-4,6-dideoxy-D-galactose acyltransferase